MMQFNNTKLPTKLPIKYQNNILSNICIIFFVIINFCFWPYDVFCTTNVNYNKLVEKIKIKSTKFNQKHIQIIRILYAKASEITPLLKKIIKTELSLNDSITYDNRSNSIIMLSSNENILKAKFIIKQLDIASKQVLISARIVEVNNNTNKILGIKWQNKFGISLGNIVKPLSFDVELNALENKGKLKIIAKPKLLVTNNNKASIYQGVEIPFQTHTKRGSSYLEFKQALLSLQVTPKILNDNRISLALKITNDSPDYELINILGNPAIKTQKIETIINLINNETIVLGGIYTYNNSVENKKLPVISHIPLLGGIFRRKQYSTNRAEFLVFIKPSIVRNLHNQ